MKSNADKLKKAYCKISIYIFIFLVAIKQPNDISEYISIIPKSIGLANISIYIFEKWLWRYCPFIKTPRLKREYNGKLEYKYNENKATKNIKVSINQTFTHVGIKLITNEAISNSIVAEIIEENGDFILYYNYRTNPYNKYSDLNPIQIGTCRLDVSNPKDINGIYWTNRKTNGDIFLE